MDSLLSEEYFNLSKFRGTKHPGKDKRIYSLLTLNYDRSDDKINIYNSTIIVEGFKSFLWNNLDKILEEEHIAINLENIQYMDTKAEALFRINDLIVRNYRRKEMLSIVNYDESIGQNIMTLEQYHKFDWVKNLGDL